MPPAIRCPEISSYIADVFPGRVACARCRTVDVTSHGTQVALQSPLPGMQYILAVSILAIYLSLHARQTRRIYNVRVRCCRFCFRGDDADCLQMLPFPSLGSEPRELSTEHRECPTPSAAGFSPGPEEEDTSTTSSLVKFTWQSPVPHEPNFVLETVCGPIYKTKVQHSLQPPATPSLPIANGHPRILRPLCMPPFSADPVLLGPGRPSARGDCARDYFDHNAGLLPAHQGQGRKDSGCLLCLLRNPQHQGGWRGRARGMDCRPPQVPSPNKGCQAAAGDSWIHHPRRQTGLTAALPQLLFIIPAYSNNATHDPVLGLRAALMR